MISDEALCRLAPELQIVVIGLKLGPRGFFSLGKTLLCFRKEQQEKTFDQFS